MFKLAILIVSSPSSGVQAKIKTEIMIEHHYKGTRNTFCPLLYELRLKVMQENGFFSPLKPVTDKFMLPVSRGFSFKFEILNLPPFRFQKAPF